MGSRSSTPRFFILATLLALTTPGVSAYGAEASNRVIIEHGKLAIDHTQSIVEITRAQAKDGFRATHGAEIGLGLFQNRMATTLEPAPGNAKGLALVTRIRTEPIIFVAKEFASDSCAYRVVLAHEHQHYLFDRDVLRALPGEVRGITQGVFANPIPTNEAEVERAKKLFFQQFNHAYEGLSFPLHARIDNPAAYAALANQCKGEIKTRLAGQQ